MKIPRAPHAWNLTPRAAIAVQQRLARRIKTTPPRRRPRFIAGLDAAFSTDGKRCLAAVVLWDHQERKVVEQHTASRPLAFPYIPGLLSFREVPALLAALHKLRRKPDVLMCDGHGLAHPRRFGIACHVGLLCNLPSLGCAKSRLIGVHGAPARARGSRRPLLDRGETIGVVLRTRARVAPIYVSLGHRMDLPTAVQLALDCGAGFRLPEPTRLADHLVARAKKCSAPAR